MNVKTYQPVIEVILFELRKLGVKTITCQMHGSNDEGCTEAFELFDAFGNAIKLPLEQTVSYEVICANWYKPGPVYKDSVPLKSAIEDHIEAAVDATDIDWYNGSGGEADYTLDIVDGIETIVMSQNVCTVVLTAKNTY